MSSYGGSYSNISSLLKTPTVMEQLIEEINFQRAKEMRQLLKDDGYGGGVQGTTYWTDLFVRHFLFQTELSIDCDDLLFFVRKKHIKGSSRFLPKFETEVEVFRKDSKKLPIGDPDIDWEETVYLNLIIHQFDYMLTLAICTRTSPKQLQILRRHSQKVYASPSRRRMDIKGDAEDMTYPYICFMVDNFDEVFSDIMVRDGEMVCVELVASDREGSTQGVIFLGSIRYDALKWVYEARASTTAKMSQRMTFGLFSSASSGRIEYVRMKGPDGKGHAEMAVSKPPGAGCETPTSEPGFCAVDMWDQDWNQDPEDFFLYRHQRRLSDPSANINYFVRGGWKSKPDSAGARARSENEGLDSLANTMTEIEAGDVRDELDDGAYNPLWTMKGFTQTFHFWKENKRAQSIPLNAFLTYVTLPWWTIARGYIMRRFSLLCVLLSLASTALAVCVRQPHFTQTVALKTPGDDGFRIQLNGDPERYVPGSSYVLSLKGGRSQEGQLKRFKSFILTVDAAHGQSDDPVDLEGNDSPLRVGTFMLYSDEHTRYHDDCVNTVKESDGKEKTEVQVMWQAPPKGSGCVTFRAMVLVDKDTWYADEGSLVKKICEITPEYLRGGDELEESSLDCCSCDEAKYTMVFEGLWSSATHPKDYPTNLWLTHFSDVIGATHGKNFTFWGEGQIASDGLRQVAEWGSARGLEAELRAKARHLRTLIKAAGLWHPRVNENTTGSFRVDRRRNLFSVVSMFGPSPDWIVGVSGMNLCKRDCTWIESKIIDLYPYDAGTDSGITYMSPNEPTNPRERIHRITSLYPEDPRSPFYDPQGKPMKPLAKLYLKLNTVTPKQCTDEIDGTVDLPPVVDVTENTEDTRRPECNVTDYTPWSLCSVTCGKGIRMRTRSYLMPQKAQMLGCDRQLVSKEMCVADQASCSDGPFQYPSPFQYLPDSEELIEDTEAYCETSPFGEWSECSTTCGVGVAMRTRRFLDRWGRKKCPHVSLVEKRECVEPPCPPPSPGINMDPRCTTSEWTDWSPCSVTCGTGLMYRSRKVLVGGELKDICAGRVELNQQRICTLQADCSVDRASAKQLCMLEPDSGPCRGFFERWYFDPREKKCITFPYGGCRGNRNNFKLESECTEACGAIRDELLASEVVLNEGAVVVHGTSDSTKVDCVVDEWSEWTPCSVSCGQGKSVRMRMVKVQPQNGGRPCPKRLLKKRVCQGPPCSFGPP